MRSRYASVSAIPTRWADNDVGAGMRTRAAVVPAVAVRAVAPAPVERLLTHRIGLDGLDAGFDRLARGEGVRQVVVL